MAYGTVKVDNITFDQGGADQNVTASGIYRAITSGVTVSGTIAGAVLIGTTTVSGTTVTGTTANFASGVFTTQVSGATVTGTQASFTSGNFVTLSGATATFTSGVIASGTAAAPSLSILGDANTGIYSPGADQVAISTNGTGRLFVNASGNVGVGTSGPNAALDVRSATTWIGDGAVDAFLQFNQSATAANRWHIGAGSGNALIFYKGTYGSGSETARIDSSGRLGLGTSSPSVRLQVQDSIAGGSDNTIATLHNFSDTGGDTRYTGLNFRIGSDNGTSAIRAFRTNSANNYETNLSFWTNPSGATQTPVQRMTLDSTGRVGIGTTSPGQALEVSGSGVFTGGVAGQGAIIGRDGGTGGATYGCQSGDVLLTAGNTNIRFTTSAIERVRIDSSGNVGIGTSSPGSLLELSGSGNASELRLRSTDTTNAIIRSYVNSLEAGKIAFTSGRELFIETAGTERARIDSSGRLLVGTSTARANFYNTTLSALFQVEGANSGNSRSASVVYGEASASGPIFILGKHRSNSLGGVTVVSADDQLGTLSFQGSDGTEFVEGASIRAFVDGTPGADDLPSRLVFSTTADGASSPTERMRISSTGMCSINTTLAENTAYFDGKLRVLHSGTGTSLSTTGGSGAIILTTWHQATSGDNKFITFGTETTHTLRGSITYNRAGGLVAYNTTSDYRAKTILGDIDNSGETIDAFKVYRGVMNGATVERPMLVAHEAQEVAPYCVTGEKDAVDDDGNPIYQQMDHQALVPLLIAEIQQLRNRVAALEGA